MGLIAAQDPPATSPARVERDTVVMFAFQFPPHSETKLVRATHGRILDIIVDLRPESPTYLHHIAVELSADNHLALVPGARSDLTAAVTGHAAMSLELGGLPPAWFRGVEPEIPVTLKIQNPDLARHTVRLTLLTTETARTQPDPADPAKQRQIPVPLLRSLPEQILPPGETTGLLRVIVPLEVIEGHIDCVVRAEILPHAFSDKALASAYSRPFRLVVQNAVAVQLGANSLALTGNAQTKFSGVVKRTVGFTGAVDVSLLNLPAGYTAPKVTIAPDQENFEIVVSAPSSLLDENSLSELCDAIRSGVTAENLR